MKRSKIESISPRRGVRKPTSEILFFGLLAVLTSAGCVFDWPSPTQPQDATVDSGSDARTDATVDAFCDAGGRTCGVCGLSCGPNATCAHDAGQCVCDPGYQDCNQDPLSDGCESWLSYDSPEWTFYSTLDDVAAVQNPIAGPAGTVVVFTEDDFEAGFIRNGIHIPATITTTHEISIPNDDPAQKVFYTDQGAVRFFYKPNYPHDAEIQTTLLRCYGPNGHSFEITHTAIGSLYIKFEWQNDYLRLEIDKDGYSWWRDEWVVFELRWDSVEENIWSVHLNDTILATAAFPELSEFAGCEIIYVGTLPGTLRAANGVIDEIMFFRRYDYTLETVCPD